MGAVRKVILGQPFVFLLPPYEAGNLTLSYP